MYVFRKTNTSATTVNSTITISTCFEYSEPVLIKQRKWNGEWEKLKKKKTNEM